MPRKKGGKYARDKGLNFEREIVNLAKSRGHIAKRVPLSGATEYAKGDVEIGDRVFECKRVARSPLYKWLGDNHGVIIRGDREEALVVLRLEDYL